MSTDFPLHVQLRIINGYDVADRPWMVLLKLGQILCGGSILNPNFVVTAGHCMCSGQQASGPRGAERVCTTEKVDGVETNKPVYEFKEVIQMYVGINGRSITDAAVPENEYFPKKIW